MQIINAYSIEIGNASVETTHSLTHTHITQSTIGVAFLVFTFSVAAGKWQS